MRKMLTAIALSSLFAAAPALAAHRHLAKSTKTTTVVSGDAKAEGGDAAKVDAPAEKPKKKMKKSSKKTEKTEAAPAADAPAK